MSTNPTESGVTDRPRKRLDQARIRTIITGIISILCGLLAWQISVSWLGVPSYVLPQPIDVLRALIDGLSGSPFDRGSFWYHLINTLEATILGYSIGSLIGVGLAAGMAEFKAVERIVLPYVIALQSIPKIAIAPLYIIWLGYQMESKVAMAATLTLFPVLLNSLQGLANTDRERLEVMLSLKASRWDTFRLVRLPSALPLIFTGLSLGIVYAQLGTIVGEFIGAQKGMGVLMTQLQAVSDTAGVFAVLVVLAVMGFILISTLRAVHRRVVFWESGLKDLAS